MTVWLWAGFVGFILVMLALDLGLVDRRGRVITAREAVGWTLVCIGLALAFDVVVYFMYRGDWLGIGVTARHNLTGAEAAGQFFAGWLVEYSLSLDNILVMVLIFRYFRVPAALQHPVLFWGVLGALAMRGGMIGAGAALIHRFAWVEYVLGAFLVFSAVRMYVSRRDEPSPERNLVVRIARRLLPLGREYEGERFLTRIDGRLAMTPLFLVLLVVETTDVAFAVDSIPAIFGITQDAFLVFTSNVFAILGLRSLYFALAPVIDRFEHLKVSLVFVLAFVGMKMLAGYWYDVPTWASLAVIVGILGVGGAASAVGVRRGSPPDVR